MIFRTGLIIVMVNLSACVGGSMVIVGDVSEPTDADQLEIFYSRQPDCDFDVVAWIFVPSEYFSQQSLIRAMQHKAASLGASALEVTSVQKTGSTTYRGTARALNCQT